MVEGEELAAGLTHGQLCHAGRERRVGRGVPATLFVHGGGQADACVVSDVGGPERERCGLGHRIKVIYTHVDDAADGHGCEGGHQFAAFGGNGGRGVASREGIA